MRPIRVRHFILVLLWNGAEPFVKCRVVLITDGFEVCYLIGVFPRHPGDELVLICISLVAPPSNVRNKGGKFVWDPRCVDMSISTDVEVHAAQSDRGANARGHGIVADGFDL